VPLNQTGLVQHLIARVYIFRRHIMFLLSQLVLYSRIILDVLILAQTVNKCFNSLFIRDPLNVILSHKNPIHNVIP